MGGRAPVLESPLCWFSLGAADRPSVAAGDVVKVGDVLFERTRDVHLARSSGVTGGELLPGAPVDPGSHVASATARRRVRSGDRATVLFRDAEGSLRLAVGRASDQEQSVVGGLVEVVDGRGIAIRAEGDGLPGAIGWGRSVRGPLLLAVSTSDGDLRASAIDVAAAGSIVVAGARVDIEAITRARALGVRGIVCGGLMGKELRQLEASEARQRASLHPPPPFAVLVLDGYGRRPIPGPAWDALSAAAGREVSLLTDPPLVLLGAGVIRRPAAELVRVTAGAHLGREGRLLDLRGLHRGAGGVYLPAGLVSLDGRTPGDPVERQSIALADLERLD
ncbi:MAG: hypothetical protein M3452_01115 [Chloroflexota bacterium]|nr:hypothetical protein [Chloroflexota bacterium]